LGFSSRKSLEAIDSSLAPDNIDFPSGMSFSQKKIGKELRISISMESTDSKKIETLISTLDEILAHIYSATRTIEKAEST